MIPRVKALRSHPAWPLARLSLRPLDGGADADPTDTDVLERGLLLLDDEAWRRVLNRYLAVTGSTGDDREDALLDRIIAEIERQNAETARDG